MSALSVSISTSSSPRLTSSPSDFSHLRIVPSSIESERRGIATSAMPGSVPANRRSRPQRERAGAPVGSAARERASTSTSWPRRDVAADGHHADHTGALVAHRDGLHGEGGASAPPDPVEVARLAGERRAQQRVERARRRPRSPSASSTVPALEDRAPPLDRLDAAVDGLAAQVAVEQHDEQVGDRSQEHPVELVAALEGGGDAALLAGGGQVGQGRERRE